MSVFKPYKLFSGLIQNKLPVMKAVGLLADNTLNPAMSINSKTAAVQAPSIILVSRLLMFIMQRGGTHF